MDAARQALGRHAWAEAYNLLRAADARGALDASELELLAEAAGLDYIGTGVNHAARIGAAAQGAEILVSAATLDAARRSTADIPRRTLHLKGIGEPVEVAAIAW